MGGRGTTSKDRYKSTGARSADAPGASISPEDSGIDENGQLRDPDVIFDEDSPFGSAEYHIAEGYDALEDSFDSDMKAAMRAYSHKGDEDINGFLRYGLDQELKLFYDKEDLDTAISSLDKAMAKSLLQESTALYRGISGDLVVGLSKGDIITDKGFVSTSLSEKVARGFADENASSGAVSTAVLHIYAPKGTKALPLSDKVSSHGVEVEYLVNRNPKFRIDSINKLGSHRDIYVTLLK